MPFGGPLAANALRSMPAQKPRPAPVITPAVNPSSPSSSLAAASTALGEVGVDRVHRLRSVERDQQHPTSSLGEHGSVLGHRTDVRRRARRAITSAEMDTTDFTFQSDDGTTIIGYRWSAQGEPKAIVQLAHGMGEHAARYPGSPRRSPARLRRLRQRPPRPRAHGRRRRSATATSGRPGGTGWSTTSGRRQRSGSRGAPRHPAILMGHSMGSFAPSSTCSITAPTSTPPSCPAPRRRHARGERSTRSQPADLSAFNAAFEPAEPVRVAQPRRGRGRPLCRRPGCGFSLDRTAMAEMVGAPGRPPIQLVWPRSDPTCRSTWSSGTGDPLTGASP